MTHLTSARVLALVLACLATGPVHAQTPVPGPIPPPAAPSSDVGITPLRIQVVIARYQGEKRVSSLPYTLSINAQNTGRTVGQIRMGADIPIRAEGAAADSKTGGVNYDQVGTQIDCIVRLVPDGRYALELSVSDKTVYADGDGEKLSSPSLLPTFRSFRATNSVLLRDGQSTQFTAATDRLTGDVVRVDVTLHVIK